ncbi:MAG: O-antigen ligase family protein, partial [Candidatus Omnitrophica bacterium]|nr:O-antigen ligase family protein [Candidatus Omnitrophota bacterium]
MVSQNTTVTDDWNRWFKWANRFDQAMAFSFYGLIFFLPISIAMVEWFTGLSLLFFILKRGCHFRILFQEDGSRKKSASNLYRLFVQAFNLPSTSLNPWVWYWCGICLFSSFFSPFFKVSLIGFLGKILQNVFLFFNFYEAIRDRKRINAFIGVWCFSVGLIVISGLVQYFTGEDFLRHRIVEDGRLSSSLRAPNDFGVYLVTIFPFLITSVMQMFAPRENGVPFQQPGIKRSILKIALPIFLIALVICIGLTFSRGSWLACGMCLAFMVFQDKKLVKWVLPMGGVFFVVFTMKMLDDRSHANMLSLLSTFGRSSYWREGFNMLRDYPLTGVGINAYSLVGR